MNFVKINSASVRVLSGLRSPSPMDSMPNTAISNPSISHHASYRHLSVIIFKTQGIVFHTANSLLMVLHLKVTPST